MLIVKQHYNHCLFSKLRLYLLQFLPLEVTLYKAFADERRQYFLLAHSWTFSPRSLKSLIQVELNFRNYARNASTLRFLRSLAGVLTARVD